MVNSISKAFAYSVLAGILWAAGPREAYAQSTPSTVYAQIGPLSLPIPWQNTSLVYLYSITEKANLVGGEMTFATMKIGSYQGNPIDLDLTAGGVVNPAGNNLGTAFAGLDLGIPNPIPAIAAFQGINPGLFAGYDVNQHLWELGVKASLNIFRG
jgi:hypothetical protein